MQIPVTPQLLLNETQAATGKRGPGGTGAQPDITDLICAS